jgi:hypothetical protein
MGKKKKQQQSNKEIADTEDKALLQEIKAEKKRLSLNKKEETTTLPGKATSELASPPPMKDKRSRKYSK